MRGSADAAPPSAGFSTDYARVHSRWRTRFAAALTATLWLAASPARGASGGLLGDYPMGRDASGTSWQPDSTPMEGVHLMRDGWMVMAHGYAEGVYDRQGGPRGGAKGVSESMLMIMAQHPLAGGTLGLRGMASLDPAMGASGYPLLLQTGETADGVTPLVDRQHPHDFLMELAATYSHPLAAGAWGFAYFGLPGEPALGPTTFMHRFSAAQSPQAPITHHWLDSTHVTEGVATAGLVWGGWKLDGSAFRGREPDQYRWDVEKPGFDSFSGRLTWNPSREWSLQASYGHLVSPEQLEPGASVGRVTASATWNFRAADYPGQATFAWGENRQRPGRDLDAFLLEAALRVEGAHTVFGRVERVDKDELAVPGVFTVDALSLGYLYDFARWGRSTWGAGAVVSVYPLPGSLRSTYGPTPGSLMLFLRAKLS